MLQIKNVSHKYDKGYVLRKLNLEIQEGECMAILGRSGCGKSTLLHIMSGILKQFEGEVLFQGEKMEKPNGKVALVFQDYGLLPWKTAKQNMLLPVKLGRRKIENEKWNYIVNYLQLEEVLDKYPAQLSGGQKQRVALGRTILSEASVLLMDEPFSALDIGNKEKVQDFLKKMFQDMHMTAVIVTHSVEEALKMGDRVAVFDAKEGKIGRIIDNPNQDRNNISLIREKEKMIKEFLRDEKNIQCVS